MLVLDCETTTSNEGNPFDASNKLCYLGLYDGRTYHLFDVEYSGPSGLERLQEIQDLVDGHDLIVGFNLKFDLHWLRRYGINFSKCSVHDCQLVHFILSNQTIPYPSLEGVSTHYGIGHKLDVVASDYWNKGIDTPQIPREILEEYLQQDLWLTYQIYLRQLNELENAG